MAWSVLSFCLGWYSIDHSSHYDKHPRHAEAIGDHAEARRKKSFRHGHLYLASLGERGKQPFRLNFIRYRERQRKALEARLALAVAIGSHDCRVAKRSAACMILFSDPGGSMPGGLGSGASLKRMSM